MHYDCVPPLAPHCVSLVIIMHTYIGRACRGWVASPWENGERGLFIYYYTLPLFTDKVPVHMNHTLLF